MAKILAEPAALAPNRGLRVHAQALLDVLTAAKSLSRDSSRLKAEVETFLRTVRSS